MDCQVVLMRHGQTDANVTRILQGQLNSHLSELGHAQAEAAADYLADVPFEAAYASDLDRAMDTARAVVARHPGLELHPEPLLREWNLGFLQGQSWNDLMKIPGLQKLQSALAKEGVDCQVPGGESKWDLQARADRFLEMLLERHCGQTILVVTHAGFLRRIFRRVVGITDECNLLPRTDNASIHRIIHREGGWCLTGWNDISHLRHLPKS